MAEAVAVPCRREAKTTLVMQIFIFSETKEVFRDVASYLVIRKNCEGSSVLVLVSRRGLVTVSDTIGN